MIRPHNNEKPSINLDGPDGNAFCLMGTAQNLARRLKLNPKRISEEMRSGDYEHLIATFDKYFGEYVDLVRTSR